MYAPRICIHNFRHNENPTLHPGEDVCDKRWRQCGAWINEATFNGQTRKRFLLFSHGNHKCFCYFCYKWHLTQLNILFIIFVLQHDFNFFMTNEASVGKRPISIQPINVILYKSYPFSFSSGIRCLYSRPLCAVLERPPPAAYRTLYSKKSWRITA